MGTLDSVRDKYHFLIWKFFFRFGTVQMVFKKNDGYKREPVVISFISSGG